MFSNYNRDFFSIPPANNELIDVMMWVVYYLTPNEPKCFFGNIAILGNSLQIEFLFIFFEIFAQHFLEEYL